MAKGRKLEGIVSIVDWGSGMCSPTCAMESPWIEFSDGVYNYRWYGGDIYDLELHKVKEVRVTAYVRAGSDQEDWQTRRLYRVKVEKV